MTSELPQMARDRTANVDTGNFAAAAEMSRGALMQMADIAAGRGEPNRAQRWKMLALQHVAREDTAAQRAELDNMMSVKATTPAGTQLVEKADDSPWSNDEVYQGLVEQVTKAELDLSDMRASNPDFTGQSIELGRLRQMRDDRAAEVREQAMASGSWTATDEVVRGAQASLDRKAGKVAKMFTTGKA